MQKKILPILILFIMGFIIAVVIWIKPSSRPMQTNNNMPPDNKDIVLTLGVMQRRISRGDFFSGKIGATVFLTNNSKKKLEFITNGPTCFQFLDITFIDQQGKNHATQKIGDAYISTIEAEDRVVINPGETVGGSIGLAIVLWNQSLRGTYNVQAFFRYQDLNVSSNVVQVIIEN